MSGTDIAALRRMISSIDGNRPHDGTRSADAFTLGFDDADHAFPHGVPRDAVHELFAMHGGAASAVAGFALSLFLRAAPPQTSLIWLDEDAIAAEHGGLYPPGLISLGFDPERLLLVRCATANDVLKGTSDALEAGRDAIGGIIATITGAPRCLDLTASRRLLLGAREAGLPVFLLRNGDPATNSAAVTRWRIGAAPSRSSGAQAPGHPTFDVTLERNRHGSTGHWIMEWNNEQSRFEAPQTIGQTTPFSGPVVSPSFNGQVAARRSPLRRQ